MDIKDLSIKDLKEMAYNELRKFDVARQNLQILNARIQELENATPEVQEVQTDTNH